MTNDRGALQQAPGGCVTAQWSISTIFFKTLARAAPLCPAGISATCLFA